MTLTWSSLAAVTTLGLVKPVACIDIGAVISDAIKQFFRWLFVDIIYGSIRDLAKYVAVKTAESVRALATDMLAALSEVGSEVSAKANDTFSQIFSLASLNTTQRVLGLMHRGQLPLEYYLRPIDVEVEMAFLDSIVDKMEVTIIVCSLVTTVCILLCCGLLCSFLSSRSDVRKANEEEEKAVSELGAAEEQKKKLIRSQETKDAEARKLYMALLSGEGGPLGMALTRPNNRRRRPS